MTAIYDHTPPMIGVCYMTYYMTSYMTSYKSYDCCMRSYATYDWRMTSYMTCYMTSYMTSYKSYDCPIRSYAI